MLRDFFFVLLENLLRDTSRENYNINGDRQVNRHIKIYYTHINIFFLQSYEDRVFVIVDGTTKKVILNLFYVV